MGTYRQLSKYAKKYKRQQGAKCLRHKKERFFPWRLASGHCESVPERRKDVDSIRMTFTCFFLKDTETDGKDSVSQIIWVKYQKTMWWNCKFCSKFTISILDFWAFMCYKLIWRWRGLNIVTADYKHKQVSCGVLHRIIFACLSARQHSRQVTGSRTCPFLRPKTGKIFADERR